MMATLTSKGQITIPLRIREKFNLKIGDQLDFDENAPFLKITKIIPPQAWDDFGKNWQEPWPNTGTEHVLEILRGPVELPPVESER